MKSLISTNSPNFVGKLVLLVGANLTAIAGAGLTAAVPAILKTFEDIPGASMWVSMIVTLPALFVVVGGPIAGFLTDRLGRKPVLVGSILLSGLAGTGSFFLDNLFAILATRALVGIGIAGAMTATNALIADYFSGQQRAKFMGYQSAFLGLGVIVFMPIGGFLADISWEYTFLSYLTVLLLFLPSLFLLREPESSKSLATPQKGTGFKINPKQRIIYSAIFILQFTFITVPVFLAYFMYEVSNVGGIEVGLVGGFQGLMTFVGGMLYERISRRLSFQKVLLVGFLIFGLGFLSLGLARSLVLIVLGTSLVGFGLGLNIANLTTWLSHVVSLEMRGRANGIFMTIRFLAEFLGSMAFTAIINRSSYHFGYLLSAIIVIVSGVFSFITMQVRNKTISA